jgi:F0F1-type ATP synthase membrane subunit b/b'
MSRALPKYNKRRVALIGGAAAVALSGAVIAGSALAGTPDKSSGTSNARTLAASPSTITCPDVASQLPAIPASAQAEVDRNLTLLQTQIQEANKRLVDTVGQGGPNFVNNAILGPLKDKRVATVNRIATAIGRTAAKPTGLDALAPCTLNASGTGTNTGSGTATGTASATPSTAATQQQSTGSTGTSTGDSAAGTSTGDSAAGTITCPDVASQLPAIPASAQAEVDRNLTLLQTQIDEADNRLQTTVGQGGPNFVQNAILGPLADKRKSTIDRIAIAIGRTSTKPTGLDSLAACTLTK